MSLDYFVGLLASLVLLAYLVLAMMKSEKF
jgi:hypothetical protein